MFNRLYSFLEKQNIFYNYLLGFLKNHFTSHAISILVEKISHSFTCKKATRGIFLIYLKHLIYLKAFYLKQDI